MTNELNISHETSAQEPSTNLEGYAAKMESSRSTRKPTPDQLAAIASIISFIEDPMPPSNFFVFSGYAGTGKTFCMEAVQAKFVGSKAKFAYTAPTNKAAKELRRITGEACTIYSLLGLRIDKTGELKKVVAGKSALDLSAFTAIFIDEGGMVNSNLMSILETLSELNHFKVIFMGDPAQLPPVGEKGSPIWKLPEGAMLTKVVRHDNQILKLVTSIREQVFHIAPSITLKNDHDGLEGVWKYSKNDFKNKLYDLAIAGGFSDGQQNKVIAWRNVKTQEYNQIIRQGIYGAAAKDGYFCVGERIVAAGPCIRGDDTLMSTDDEGYVESAMDCQHPMEPKYKAIELRVRTETDRVVRLIVLHPESAVEFANDLERRAHDARGNPKWWKSFWDLKDIFHEVKYAYAITAHRSQGSTYTNIWVDSQDVLMNRNRQEAFQCFYVACSRPQKQLHIC